MSRRPDLPSFADDAFLARCTRDAMMSAMFNGDFDHLSLVPKPPPKRDAGRIYGAHIDMIIMDDMPDDDASGDPS